MKSKKWIIPSILILVFCFCLYQCTKLQGNSGNTISGQTQYSRRDSNEGSSRGSRSTQDNNTTSSATSYGNYSMQYGGYEEQNANSAAAHKQNILSDTGDAMQNSAGVEINDMGIANNEQMNNNSNSLFGTRTNTQLKWWRLIEEYNIGPQRISQEYFGRSITVRDAVYDFEITENGGTIIPFVVFERNGMRAYMYFDYSYEDKIKKLTKAFPATITGYKAEFSQNTLYLYDCKFGY